MNINQEPNPMIEVWQPRFFNLADSVDKIAFQELLHSFPVVLFDEIRNQLRELIKSRNPSVRYTEKECDSLIGSHIGERSLDEYGVWVYFPWASKLVHILGEKEFIELRTSRNKYKITAQEQAVLATKTIGIIGLSVGQSVALTLAMERVCGHLRLADFDCVDLSNLNRLRTGVSSLGLKKTVVAAREILEIDPYLDVKIFSEGVTHENLNGFLLGDGKLDLLVEVCDGLEMKIVARAKAKGLRIPVVMDTNDRGMLDVERFDLEPNRPLFHGLAGGIDPEKISQFSQEQRMRTVLKLVDADNLSNRMKESMKEIGRTISSWPQLASSVALGGALTTDVCRRILLGQFHRSGRFYVDFDQLVSDHPPQLDEIDLLKIS